MGMDLEAHKHHIDYSSPSGILRIFSNGKGVTRIQRIRKPEAKNDIPDKICIEAARQLDQYYEGVRQNFDIPLDLSSGTEFQRTVWKALREISFGKTTTYGELAHYIDNPKAVRAVGTANGKNPILIMVPCHRVIGADGSLTGFSAGMDMKKQLLELETGVTIGTQASLF